MAYLLYSIIFLVLVAGTALYFTRVHWLPAFMESMATLNERLPSLRLPGRDYIYSALPAGGGSFSADIEDGLTSSTFDLGENVDAGDARGGLDAAARAEILRIMKKRRMRFDDARRVYMERRFAANGISADGRPKDPKFVSFS
jgi:hypothetical protein